MLADINKIHFIFLRLVHVFCLRINRNLEKCQKIIIKHGKYDSYAQPACRRYARYGIDCFESFPLHLKCEGERIGAHRRGNFSFRHELCFHLNNEILPFLFLWISRYDPLLSVMAIPHRRRVLPFKSYTLPFRKYSTGVYRYTVIVAIQIWWLVFWQLWFETQNFSKNVYR